MIEMIPSSSFVTPKTAVYQCMGSLSISIDILRCDQWSYFFGWEKITNEMSV